MPRSWEEILQELELHRHSLILNGSVHYRPHRGTFVLRFRERTGDGPVVHRSIAIRGDEGVAEDVKTLIDQWRAQSPLGLSRAQREFVALCLRPVDSSDLSRAQKSELKRDIRRQVQAGGAFAVINAFLIGLNAEHIRPNPTGRPRKAALW